MATLRRAYRVRIHDAGTSTPADGTVDFTLELTAFPEFGRQTVHPARAHTETSPWTFHVLDAEGILTGELSDPTTGRMDLLGRLVELQENRAGAGWTRVVVGRLADLTLGDEQATYVLQVSDERWKERRAIAFDQADTVALWPAGLRYLWRTPVIYAGQGRGTVEETSGSLRRIRLRSTWPIEEDAAAFIRGDIVDAPDTSRTDGEGNFDHLRLELDGTDYPIVTFDGLGETGLLESLKDQPSIGADFAAWIYAPSLPSPEGESFRAVLWAPTAPPSETLPLHIGTLPFGGDSHTWGLPNPWELTQAVYDALGVRYDAAAFAALPAAPPMAWRLTAPVTDVAKWLDDHIYGPLGVVAFVDSEGRVAPRSIRLPTPDAFDVDTAFEFNASNLRRAPTWSNPGSDVVNVVDVVYKALVPAQLIGSAPARAAVDSAQAIPLDRILVGDRSDRYEHDTVTELGPHPVTFDLSGLPTLAEWAALAPGATGQDQVHKVAELLTRETFERWGDGPQRGTLHSLRQVQDGTGRTPEDDVEAGDLVLVNVETFPNANTRARGGTRVVQILSKHQVPEGLEFDFADVGPALQPLAAPTVSVAAHATNPRHAVTVTLSGVPAGATALLEVDIGDADTWARKIDGVGNGAVDVGRLPSGTNVTARARASAPGRTRSDWSAEDSASTSSLTAPTAGSATVDGRAVAFAWSGGTSGYRPMPVYRTPQGSGSWTEALLEALPVGATGYTFGPLAASTGYDVGVKLVDHFGGESAVASTTATTTAYGADLEAPQRPQVLQGRGASSSQAIAPPELVLGYGLQVGFRPVELHAPHILQVSTSLGFSTVELEVEVPPGAKVANLFTGKLDDTDRYVRVKASREGWTDSDWSEVVSARPTAIVDAEGPDAFPGGWAFLTVVDGRVQLNVGSSDEDTRRAYYSLAVNAAGDPPWPAVTDSDPYVDWLDFPHSDDALLSGSPVDVEDGDTVHLTVRFWHPIYGFGAAVYDALVLNADVVDVSPVLDEDEGDLNLYPGRSAGAESVRYYVRTDGSDPTLAQVRGGTVSTATEILAIHTFATDGERVAVGVLGYSNDDGTGDESGLHIRRHTYHAADDRPTVTWLPFRASDPATLEGIRLIARDPEDDVRIYWRVYEDGGMPPAWSSTGAFAADPLTQDVEVTRPDEGDPAMVLEFYAEDESGNLSHDTPQRLEIDAGSRPSGWLAVEVDRLTGIVTVTPNSMDPDSGSFRFAVNRVSAGTPTFVDPSGAGGEYSGDSADFGVPIEVTAEPLAAGEQLNISGYFYRTTLDTWVAQNASQSSPNIRVVAKQAEDTGNALKSVWLETHVVVSGILTFYRTDLHWQAASDQVRSLKVVVTDGVTPSTTRADVSGTEGVVTGVYSLTAPPLTGTVTPYNDTGADLGSGTAGPAMTVEENLAPLALAGSGSGGSVLGRTLVRGAGTDIEEGDSAGEVRVKLRLTVSTSDPSGTPEDGDLWLKVSS